MKLNDPLESHPVPTPPQRKVNAAVLLIVAAVFITIPVCGFVLVFEWLGQSAFQSVDDVNPDELDEIQIELKNLPRGPQNRPDPVAGEKIRPDENTPFHTDPDIDPTRLMRPDFAVFLNTLRNAERVPAKPPSPFLGKAELRYQDGRRGTVMLYWAPEDGRPEAQAIVWMRIALGPFRTAYFKGPSLKELRTVAQACAERGDKVRR